MAYLRNLRKNNRLRQGEQGKEMKGALGSWGRALRRVWYGLICVDAQAEYDGDVGWAAGHSKRGKGDRP